MIDGAMTRVLALLITSACSGSSSSIEDVDRHDAAPVDAGLNDASVSDGGAGPDSSTLAVTSLPCAGPAWPAAAGQWRELSLPPVTVISASTTQDDLILAGTLNGLLAAASPHDGCWRDAGFEGIPVGAILASGSRWLVGSRSYEAEETLLASNDLGTTVSPLRSGLGPIFTLLHKPTDPDFLVAGGDALVFHWSTDGGATWESEGNAVCPPCRVSIPTADPDALYTGCECPLDSAYVARYDLSDPAGVRFGIPEPEQRLGTPFLDNRRINTMRERPDRSSVLVGVEGGLVELTPGEEPSGRWIWRSHGSIASEPYVYVRVVWVDPCAPDHLVFGGPIQSESCSGAMFETHDGGASVSPLPPPEGFEWCRTSIFEDTARPAGPKGEHLLLPFVTKPSDSDETITSHAYLWSGSECPER